MFVLSSHYEMPKIIFISISVRKMGMDFCLNFKTSQKSHLYNCGKKFSSQNLKLKFMMLLKIDYCTLAPDQTPFVVSLNLLETMIE